MRVCMLGGWWRVRVCVGRVVERREEHGASVLYTESNEKLVGYETVVCVERRRKEEGGWK